METIPANLPRGEVRSRPRPAEIRAGSRCAARPSARSPLTSPLSLPSQDGYVKWDQVDIDSLKLPAGDDMGIVRYVEAERASRARDRNPTRWRSTLKRDPKPAASTLGESNQTTTRETPRLRTLRRPPTVSRRTAFFAASFCAF